MRVKIIEKFSSPFQVITYIRYLIPENDFEKQVVRVISTLKKTVRRLERQWINKAVREDKVDRGPSIFDYHADTHEDFF